MHYSVVIPCYNVAGLAKEAVASALAQTRPPLEVLCVDDGSTDGTLEVLRGLEQAHPGVVRVIAKENGGAPSARNAGLREARGEWIQFLDADDLLDPRKVEHQFELVEQAAEEGDIVAGAYRVHHLDGRIGDEPVEEMDPLCAVVLHRLGTTSANLFRKAAVEAAGGWNEAMPCSQEYELMFRMAQRGASVLVDPEPLTTVRERPGSVGKHADAFRVNVQFRGEVLRAYARRDERDPEEWQRMLDAVFNWIRMNVATQYEAAVELYEEVMPPGFVPTPKDRTTWLYTWVFRMLGFERTEQIRRLLGRTHRWVRS